MLASQIKTSSQLKSFVESLTNSLYFTRKSMQFFGDTMANYGVCRTKVKSHFKDGVYYPELIEVEVFELYRKRAVKHGLQKSAYFDAETFKLVHKVGD